MTGFEGGLASTASARPTNSSETVAVGLVWRQCHCHRTGTWWWTFQKPTRCHTRICPIRILHHSHLRGSASPPASRFTPQPRRTLSLDAQTLNAPTHPAHTSPSPSTTKDTAMKLERHKRRESSPHFRR